MGTSGTSQNLLNLNTTLLKVKLIIAISNLLQLQHSKRQKSLWLVSFLVLASFLSHTLEVSAQIIPDNTLPNNSIATPNGDIIEITGGTTAGNNLFHSFQDFSILKGQTAFFDNGLAIENILSRITGNSISNIDGLIRANGGANLFLINPNGIVFGENASLDIGGSFVATTADGIKLGEDGFFTASDPQNSQLLAVQPEVFFENALANNQGTIINRGNLAVAENLTLFANNLDLQGNIQAGKNLTLQAIDIVQIKDTIAQPFVASAGGKLLIEGSQGIDIFALNHSDSGFFSGGDMVLRSTNAVGGDAHYWSGGSFRIEQLDSSLGSLFSFYGPIISSFGDVSFNSYLGASLHILAGGAINIGTVIITDSETGTTETDFIAEDITLSDQTIVSIDGRARPTLDVRAGVDLTQVGLSELTGSNFSDIFNFAPFLGSPTILPTATSADINIGGIAMLGSLAADGVILLTNQYQPNTSLAGGNIEFGAIITTDQASGILSELPAGLRSELESFDLLNGFSGNSSDVIVDSRNSIKMVGNDLAELGLDFGLLNTSSSSGDAGDITLIANDAVSLANSFVSSDTFGTGNGGDITISANSVSVTDGTVISTSFSKGQEGRLNIDASESVELVGSALLSLAIGSGDAGEVTIKTKSLIIRDNSVITTSSLNRSNAGDLKVEVDHLIIQDGILATNTGFSPNLNPDLRTDSGKGQGGDIIIRASDFVDLTATTEDGRIFPLDTPILNDFLGVFFEEPSEITSIGTFTGLFSTAERGSQGDAGNIIITTGRLNIQGGAQASTSTLGQGQGGDLIVNASESVELIGTSINESFSSALEAETFDFGTGGNIIINTPKLIVQDGAVVSASARSLAERFGTDSIGKAGNLTVTANWVELSGTSAALKTPSALQTSTAGAGVGGNLLIDTNRLIVRDGAAIAVNSEGISEAGSIEIKADSLTLNKGFITAETASNQGGNITLEIQDTLQFIDSGEITATAGTVQGPGDGGNIKINADFILAFPTDNTYKITANAFKGNGGNIQITTKGFFGAEFVDISASSEEGLEGVVSIDILEVNPAQSLTELPSNIVDASRLIAKSCLAGGAMAEEQNEFVVTGRGGLPANPKESLRGDAVLSAEWVTLPEETAGEIANQRNKPANPSITQEIVEARGWIIGANGNVILTAAPTPVATVEVPWLIPHDCV